jgi:thiol-disulfide isomerase/thioredoxin
MRIVRYGLPLAAVAVILGACGAAPAAPAPDQPTVVATTQPAAAQPTAEPVAAQPTAEPVAAQPTAEPVAAAQPTAEPVAAQPTAEPVAAAQPTAEPVAAQPTAGPVAQAPWLAIPLTDVRTGEAFTLADFAGSPVYVETMATWCPKCRDQLVAVQAAKEALPAGEAVFVAISVESDLAPEQLARYAEANGFTMRFAVASPELLRALTDSFGRTINNPPATPHFTVAPDGSHGELLTGASPTERVIELVQKARGGM